MEFKSVMGERKYFKYKECNSGDVLVESGKFMGTEQGKYGEQHLFEMPDNTTVVLNSSAHLNHLVRKYLHAGTTCRVIYQGTATQTKGPMIGKQFHKFDLQIPKTINTEADTVLADADVIEFDVPATKVTVTADKTIQGSL